MNKKQWEIYYDALKLGEWEKALGALNKILKDEPRNSQVHLKIGDVFQKAGDKSNAIAAYNQSARLLIDDGFAHKAIAIFKIILRLDPENEEAAERLQQVVTELEIAKIDAMSATHSVSPAVEESAPEAVTPDTELLDATMSGSSFSAAEEDFVPQVPFDEVPSVPEQHGSEFGLQEGPEVGPDIEQETGIETTASGEPGFESPGSEESSKSSDAVSGQEEQPSFALDEQSDPGLSAESGFGLDNGRENGFEQPSASDFGSGYEEGESGEPLSTDSSFGREATEGDSMLSAPSFEFGDQSTETIPGQVPSFLSFMPESESGKFMEKAVSRAFSPNEIVVKEGGTGDSVYVIRSGNAKVVVHVIGKEIELATLSPGDVFGEVAFLTGRPRTASVMAVGDLEVMEFDKALLQEILEAYPDTLRKMDDFFQYHLHDTLDKVKARIKEK